MQQPAPCSTCSHRDRWLALLDQYDVGHPKSLDVIEVPGGVIQATVGEPAGAMEVQEVPANVLMFNLSPVQSLGQTRGGRSFLSHMLRGDMTLMPPGVPSRWSWNSSCDRLDVILFPNVLGDENKLEVVDRFLFRDRKLEAICRGLFREIGRKDRAERLYLESLVMDLSRSLLEAHSTTSKVGGIRPSSALPRNQLRHVVEYIESNLPSDVLTIHELARIADLSPHHFARMFKQSLGVSPHRYILERRVERAKQMLASGRTLAETSFTLGFSSQSHFSSSFHRLTGLTPSEFERSRSNRPRPSSPRTTFTTQRMARCTGGTGGPPRLKTAAGG